MLGNILITCYMLISINIFNKTGCYISFVLTSLEIGRLLSCLTGSYMVIYSLGTGLFFILHLLVFEQRQERWLQTFRLKVCHLSVAASLFSLLA